MLHGWMFWPKMADGNSALRGTRFRFGQPTDAASLRLFAPLFARKRRRRKKVLRLAATPPIAWIKARTQSPAPHS